MTTTATYTAQQEATQTETTPTGAAQPQTADTAGAFTITSFVLALASIVSGWTFFVPAIGLVFGILALRRGTTQRTLALWGVWLNAAMLSFTVLAGLFVTSMLAFGFLAIPFAG